VTEKQTERKAPTKVVLGQQKDEQKKNQCLKKKNKNGGPTK